MTIKKSDPGFFKGWSSLLTLWGGGEKLSAWPTSQNQYFTHQISEYKFWGSELSLELFSTSGSAFCALYKFIMWTVLSMP